MGTIRKFKRLQQNQIKREGYKNFLPGDYVILSQQVGHCDPGWYRFEEVYEGVAFLTIGNIFMTADLEMLDYCEKTIRPSREEIKRRFNEHQEFFSTWQKGGNVYPNKNSLIRKLADQGIKALHLESLINMRRPTHVC